MNIAFNLGMTEMQLQHLLTIVEKTTGKSEADKGRKVLSEVIEAKKK